MPRLEDLARVTGGVLHGTDAVFLGAVIDSRKCRPGQLFVALPGAQADGHDFVAAAAEAGAAGALVRERQPVDLPQVVVNDALAALQQYAAHHRQSFQGPVIGVTGTNGKTTTKEILAAVLSHAHGAPVLYTQGNLNNHIGVPLTLLGLSEAHPAAVIEMGANHIGDIKNLSSFAQPDIGIVTLAGAGHLEGFGSVEGVARGKGEMFSGLPRDGVAVINADDVYADLWRGLAGQRRQITFGLGEADVSAGEIRSDDEGQVFSLKALGSAVQARLPLSGEHNVRNALAATAAALAAGLSLESIVAGLATASAVGGRLQSLAGPGGARIIDDSYNANPTSVKAAIDWLAQQPGQRWLVLGDMAELGDEAVAWHHQVGEQARAAGLERMWTVGRLSQAGSAAFGEGARHSEIHAEVASELQAALAGAAAAEVTVLVKGSRSMKMEQIVKALVTGADVSAPQSDQVVNGG